MAIVPAVECEGGEVLMISLLRGILPKEFTCLVNRDRWSHPSGVSKCEKNPARGGHSSVTKSGGRKKQKATDIYLKAWVPYEKKLGDLLCDAFVRNRKSLGIDHVIWDKRQSTGGGSFKAYTGTSQQQCADIKTSWRRDPCFHRDHLHVEFLADKGDEDHSAELERIVAEVKEALAKAAP